MSLEQEQTSILQGFSDWLFEQFAAIRKIERKIEERIARREKGARRGKKLWDREKELWKEEVLRYWKDSNGLEKFIVGEKDRKPVKPTKYRFNAKPEICTNTDCNGRCGMPTPDGRRRKFRFRVIERWGQTVVRRLYHRNGKGTDDELTSSSDSDNTGDSRHDDPITGFESVLDRGDNYVIVGPNQDDDKGSYIYMYTGPK